METVYDVLRQLATLLGGELHAKAVEIIDAHEHDNEPAAAAAPAEDPDHQPLKVVDVPDLDALHTADPASAEGNQP